MPVITVEAGEMSKNQKEALIQEFTKTASEILNIPMHAFVILLKENDSENVGSGGRMLSEVIAERNKSKG